EAPSGEATRQRRASGPLRHRGGVATHRGASQVVGVLPSTAGNRLERCGGGAGQEVMSRAHPWLVDPVVRRQLEAVQALITEAVCRGGPCPEFHKQLLSPRSKRLRPALLLLAARFGPCNPETLLVKAAAGIELLHEGTLYHDDIVDEAPLRRGTASVQAACGPVVAAFAGSELLYSTPELFADLP